MKHSKFIAVIVVSVMMFSVVQPVIAEGRTWKEWGRDVKNTAEEAFDMNPGTGTEFFGIDVSAIVIGAVWVVGATVEYFADDEPEEEPQEEQKSS